jgi:deoxycytidine triphosphate deaminase
MSISNKNVDNLLQTMKLEKLVSIPEGWEDLPGLEHIHGKGGYDWEKFHARHIQGYSEWLEKMYSRFGNAKEIENYRKCKPEDIVRAEAGGVLNLTAGFFISLREFPRRPFTTADNPLAVHTINILRHMHSSHLNGGIVYPDYPSPDLVGITAEGVLLNPGESVNMYALEYVTIPPESRGLGWTKSIAARARLDVLQGAGNFNPGWEGVPLLEITNGDRLTIIVKVGVPLAQICLMDISATPGVYQDGRPYQRQNPKEQ